MATLILNKRARQSLENDHVPVRWAAGLDVDVAIEEEFWVEFCWRMQHRLNPRRRS